MPGGATHFGGLDVQFGNWDKEEPFSFNNAPVNTASSVPANNQRAPRCVEHVFMKMTNFPIKSLVLLKNYLDILIYLFMESPPLEDVMLNSKYKMQNNLVQYKKRIYTLS